MVGELAIAVVVLVGLKWKWKDGSSLIGGGGRLRRNGSRSHTVSASKMRGSFNRSQSGFIEHAIKERKFPRLE